MIGSAELEALKGQNRFAETILIGWSCVETLLEGVVLMEYGFFDDYYNLLAKPLKDFKFDSKLRLMRQAGRLTESDFKVLHRFQEDRNKFFHQSSMLLTHLDDSMKESLMTHAIEATKVMERVFKDSFPKRKTR